MSKKSGFLLIGVGAVLILSALLLSALNHAQDVQAGEGAESLMVSIRQTIPTAAPEPEIPRELSPEMPVTQLDGDNYIGSVSIPALDRELPIMADWDYNKLKVSPCRHFGSTRTDDLVIAAHDYKRHFGGLDTLQVGDEVIVTDMEGIVNRYQVTKQEILEPTAVDEVKNSGHDLVLYTCTYTGTTRIVVFCDRIEE